MPQGFDQKAISQQSLFDYSFAPPIRHHIFRVFRLKALVRKS